MHDTVIDREFYEELRSYPEELLKATGVSDSQIDVETQLDLFLTNGFSTMADVSTDPNANITATTYATVLQECQKGAMKRHALREVYRKAYSKWGKATADRILKAEIEGRLYFSDLHLFGAPYCYNFSACWLMHNGLPFIPRIPSKPARHADSFIQQCTQLLMFASNHQSGACALTGFFPALDWYFKKDGIVSKKQKLQMLQEFTYTMNQPVRFSAQTPFLNLSIFDRYYLESLYGDFKYPDGSKPDIESIVELQKLYGEWMVDEMTTKGVIFTFPVLTCAFLIDKETRQHKDPEFLDWAVKTNAALGTMNFYQSDRAGSLSSCCRLSNDIDLLQELGYVNSFGAGGDGVGSTGVVTVNLPHVVLEAQRDGRDVKEALEEAVTDAQRAAWIRNQWVRENIKRGLFPLYDYGFIDINSQYCTVGICGMFEAACASGVFSGGNLTHDELEAYEAYAKDILSTINQANIKAAEEYHVPFNLEQVPAEGQAVTLALKDRILGLQDKFDMYSNQWVPLSENEVDVFTRIGLAGTLDTACSGGAILHITTGTKVTAAVQKSLLQYCAREGVVYCALNYTLTRCGSCGTVTAGDIAKCPECGATNVEAYTRVVGFVTPVRSWHAKRREEFYKRKRYSNLDARQKEIKNLIAGNAA